MFCGDLVDIVPSPSLLFVEYRHRDMALPIVVRGILIEPFDYQTQQNLILFLKF